MISKTETFFSIYTQGFLRAKIATHIVSPALVYQNARQTLAILKDADREGVGLVVLPELGLTGYAIDDLLHQQAILDEVERELELIIKETKSLLPVCVIGVPLRWRGSLFNCAAVVHKGSLLGVVPKVHLPNYREFYEARHFCSGAIVPNGEELVFRSTRAPFGTDLLFCAEDKKNFILSVEVCEDLWVPIPPSSHASLAGATVIANLSASNAVIGKAEDRSRLCQVQSSRCNAAYLYSAAGFGESTTDLSWDGHALAYENGLLLDETKRFSLNSENIVVDIDLELLAAERIRNGSLSQNWRANTAKRYRLINFTLSPPIQNIGIKRRIERFPFVPSDSAKLDLLCEEAFAIQTQGLAKRLISSGIEKIVIGVSGGLDSTHALIVAVKTMDMLKLPRANVHAYTLPAFATSERTKSSAWHLMRSLGVSAEEIDIAAACMQMFRDIRHSAAYGDPSYDVTFENVQAGARTSLLFRLANKINAIVLGTGDLSELALGWCTYGVGDHMSHYNVNSSVPKTLIQYLIRWIASKQLYGQDLSKVLYDILASDISPELIPSASYDGVQRSEDTVGPYSLQDFNLFYFTRYGLRPSKIAFLAWHAWNSKTAGTWPPNYDEEKKQEYDLQVIHDWLRVFIRRFFGLSQYKRSALPNGPKISSGGSLSPRGDWRMPSDCSPQSWLDDLENIPLKS